MEQAELERIIEQARIDRRSVLDLSNLQLNILPESIGNLTALTDLYLENNNLSELPYSLGNLSCLKCLTLMMNRLSALPESISFLSNLTCLSLDNNFLKSIPKSVCKLSNLQYLSLDNNQIASLPDEIGVLSQTGEIHLRNNLLNQLPDSIGNLQNLTILDLQNNHLTALPESIANLSKLEAIYLDFNPLIDLSALQKSCLKPSQCLIVFFLDIALPPRYCTKFSEWKSEWLLDENNSEVRRVLIKQLGYEKICEELNANTCDIWREYTLIKINEVEIVYDGYDEPIDSPEATLREREPMVLLKMTCPSTGHIHILRVPPNMTSAEEAITWVNHGIHPDKFTMQT